MSKRKDDDVDEELSPFADLRKNVVLREARIFNDRELNPQRCAQVLTKLLYLLSQGESFSSEEATEVFFAVTKLFQSPDVHLRRLIYVMIKELRVESDSSLIVVSCLSKDMTSKTDLFRANSIRVLSHIMDASMVQQMERFLKQAIVDRNPFIMASALCAAQHINNTAPDVVKRWANETQEALSNKAKMVQFHALALLYRIRGADKLALSKIVTSLARGTPSINNSSMAQLLHIRMITSLLATMPTTPAPGSAANSIHAELVKCLTDSLNAKHYLVMYEAARSMLKLDHLLTQQQLVPAISVIQEMLTSVMPAYRFAAVKTLSEVVIKYPMLVAPCLVDLEHCINDSNRTIATLAITTLLKTGVESNVDRLMKSISGFMADISDDFKIVLVEAIRALCIKFPHKFPSLLNFLSSALREEGGFKYKKAIVDSILIVISEIKEATELGLEQYCEFIEDCEFPELSVRILHVLGERGPLTTNPAKYIRFIFNRVILETAAVRCAAVASLAKFGAAVPSLTEHIVVLLQRCLMDNDDEVRDRAVFYVAALTKDQHVSRALNASKSLPSYYQLEQSLLQYLHTPQQQQHPFSLQKDLISITEDPDKLVEGANKGDVAALGSSAASPSTAAASVTSGIASPVTEVNPHLELLRSIPELSSLGPIFKSCSPVSLTEAESEYVVTCIKHILNEHVVFQFNVTNNMESQQLENVRVEMECESSDWEEELAIPEPKLQYSIGGVTFVAFRRPSNTYQSGAIACTLHFTVKDVEDGEVVDPDSAGQADEYQLEEIEVSESDFMQPGANLGFTEFKRQWEETGDKGEVIKKYSLGLDNLQSAVSAVIDLLGMQPCEQSGAVAEGSNSHAVNLTGMFFTDIKVLARAGFKLDPKHGVTLKIVVRSNNQKVNAMLTNAIR